MTPVEPTTPTGPIAPAEPIARTRPTAPESTAPGPTATTDAPPVQVPAQRGPSAWEYVDEPPRDWRPPGWPAAPPPPQSGPPILPPRPRRSPLWPLLAVLLVLSAVLAIAGGAATVATLPREAGTARTIWVDGVRPEVRDPALRALLDRRAGAVRAKDRAAFLADVDGADAGFVKRQEVIFDNLVKLDLAELVFTLETRDRYGDFVPGEIRERYEGRVAALGVTVRYRVNGVDSKPVTTPWVPIFGYVGDHWRVVAEATGKDLPYGASGQAWDAGPISVIRGPRVVVVLSADDADRGRYLLDLAEAGLDRVAAVRKGGWDGRVLVTAVQDQKLFDTYFSDSPERIAQVAAIAVPYYDRVPDWHSAPEYASTRIVFNPQELSAQPEELGHDLTHEFTHAAMGPVTTAFTPRWLVEGFAEYVAYKARSLSASSMRRALGDLRTDGGLPEDATFYNDPTNYVKGWLACKMLAEKYGEAKLLALYEAYPSRTAADTALGSVLGITDDTLDGQWRDYVARQRA